MKMKEDFLSSRRTVPQRIRETSPMIKSGVLQPHGKHKPWNMQSQYINPSPGVLESVSYSHLSPIAAIRNRQSSRQRYPDGCLPYSESPLRFLAIAIEFSWPSGTSKDFTFPVRARAPFFPTPDCLRTLVLPRSTASNYRKINLTFCLIAEKSQIEAAQTDDGPPVDSF